MNKPIGIIGMLGVLWQVEIAEIVRESGSTMRDAHKDRSERRGGMDEMVGRVRIGAVG